MNLSPPDNPLRGTWYPLCFCSYLLPPAPEGIYSQLPYQDSKCPVKPKVMSQKTPLDMKIIKSTKNPSKGCDDFPLPDASMVLSWRWVDHLYSYFPSVTPFGRLRPFQVSKTSVSNICTTVEQDAECSTHNRKVSLYHILHNIDNIYSYRVKVFLRMNLKSAYILYVQAVVMNHLRFHSPRSVHSQTEASLGWWIALLAPLLIHCHFYWGRALGRGELCVDDNDNNN